MKLLQENVIFNVIDSQHLKTKERIEIKLEPASDTSFKNLAPIRLPDRKTNPMTRIFLKSVGLDYVTDISKLTNQQVKGNIVEFSKTDGTKFIGVETKSIDIVNPILIKPQVKSMKNSKSFIDVAVDALLKLNKPTNYHELSNYILQNDMYISQGKRPYAALACRIGSEIKSKGAASRFIKEPNGFISLNSALYPQFNVSLIPTLVPTELQSVPAVETEDTVATLIQNLFSSFLKVFQ